MQNKLNITGITKLRNDLIMVYQGLRTKSINGETAKPFTDVAGKILKSAKIQIEYQTLMKTKRKIDFLEK